MPEEFILEEKQDALKAAAEKGESEMVDVKNEN